MSLIKPSIEKVSAETWIAKLQENWTDAGIAKNIIDNNKYKMFKEKLNIENAWEWFRLILLIDKEDQLKWLEQTILNGVAIDGHWTKLDTGHRITVFDLIEQVSGGMRPETRKVIKHIYDIYSVLFLKKDVQLALDIIEELEEDKRWMELNMVLSCYVSGPLCTTKPLLHYVVLMERYDLVRGLLSAATTLHNEFSSATFLTGWMNMKDEMGRTVLHITAIQRRESWAKWFVSNYANPFERDKTNKTPFHYAITMPYLQIFWDKMENTDDKTLLNELLVEGPESKEALQYILDRGADPNIKGALNKAINQEEYIPILCNYGADPTLIKPDSTWDSKSIKEWIWCGGGNIESYSQLLIKHSGATPVWICFMLALQYGFAEEAVSWGLKCDQDQLIAYKCVIFKIIPKSHFMSRYKMILEQVVNKCISEYKKE